MKVSLAIHVIGICFWLGGLILGSRIIATLSELTVVPKKLCSSLILFSTLGLVLTVATGVYQISLQGISFYFSQGWFHTKVTLVIALLVLSLLFISHLKNIGRGATQPKKGLMMMIHGVSSLILVGNVFLTILMGTY